MHVDLSHDEAAALVRKLQAIVENDRYPLSRRIRTLRGILAKLRPEPVHEPLPPRKVDERRRTTAATRRREFNDHSRNAQAVTADHQMVDRQLGWDAPSDQPEPYVLLSRIFAASAWDRGKDLIAQLAILTRHP